MVPWTHSVTKSPLEEDDVLKFNSGALTFQLTLEEGHTADFCRSAFTSIIELCVGKEGNVGGEVEIGESVSNF